MARYIDADKLLEQVNSLEQLARKRVYDTPTNSPAYERYSTQYREREKMLSIIKAQPTADVAPKDEVAREIFEEIEKVVNYALCVDITDWSAYTELKKKYTEDV